MAITIFLFSIARYLLVLFQLLADISNIFCLLKNWADMCATTTARVTLFLVKLFIFWNKFILLYIKFQWFPSNLSIGSREVTDDLLLI
jgi:hypothetical protein